MGVCLHIYCNVGHGVSYWHVSCPQLEVYIDSLGDLNNITPLPIRGLPNAASLCCTYVLTLNENEIKQIINSLSALYKLSFIHLSFKNGNIGDKGTFLLAQSLIKLNSLNKIILDLTGNKITDKGVENLSEMINAKNKQKFATFELNLKNNMIRDEGCLKLMKSIKMENFTNNCMLDLSDNKITEPTKKEMRDNLKFNLQF